MKEIKINFECLGNEDIIKLKEEIEKIEGINNIRLIERKSEGMIQQGDRILNVRVKSGFPSHIIFEVVNLLFDIGTVIYLIKKTIDKFEGSVAKVEDGDTEIIVRNYPHRPRPSP